MSEEQDPLQIVAKEAYKHAANLQLNGAVPVFLGVKGLLALMHHNIRLYSEKPTRESLLSLVAHGLFALELETENEAWLDEETEISTHPLLGVVDVPEGEESPPSRLTYENVLPDLRKDVEDDIEIIEDEEDDGSGRWTKVEDRDLEPQGEEAQEEVASDDG